jgi:hypothetical protein
VVESYLLLKGLLFFVFVLQNEPLPFGLADELPGKGRREDVGLGLGLVVNDVAFIEGEEVDLLRLADWERDRL